MAVVVALEAKSQAHRDVLFASGCGLVGIGLFPFLHTHYMRWFLGLGASSELAADRRRLPTSPMTHTAFDLATCGFGAAFALLGVGVMFLSCLLLPRRSTRACLKTVGVPLAVVAAGAALLVHAFYANAELAATWRANVQREFAFDDQAPSRQVERRSDTRVLEFQVNKHFCRALGDRVCLDGSVREAQLLFSSLPAWPPAADPHATVANVCYEAAAATDVERLATDAVDAELRVCRVCSSVTRGASRRRPSMLELIRSPSQDAVRWCGEYLLTWRAGANLTNAPFQQHREEVLSKWRSGDGSSDDHVVEGEDATSSPLEAALVRSVRLLLVLVWFSLPALVIMVRWYVTPEREQWEWGVVDSA